MKTLVEIQRAGEKQLGIYTLTADYEIVYILMDRIEMSPDSLQRLTRLSSTALYSWLKRLLDDGVIASQVNPNDKRGRLYSLSEEMRRRVMNQHKGYMQLVRSRGSDVLRAGQDLDAYRSYIKRGMVNHLTAEFQILLYLYLKAGISNLDMSLVVDVSITKFHTTLTKLVSMGLIEFDKDPADGRSKLYRLSKLSDGVLDQLHDRVFQWLEECAPSLDVSARA